MTTMGKNQRIVNNKPEPNQAQSIMDLELRAKREHFGTGRPREYRYTSSNRSADGVPLATLTLKCHTLEMARLYQRDGGSKGEVQMFKEGQWQAV